MGRKLILLLFLFLLQNCKEQVEQDKGNLADNKKIYKLNEIPKAAIKSIGGNNSFIYEIKFSNLIYHENGKDIKIPIFRGFLKDVRYNDFLKYCESRKILKSGVAESGFIFFSNKGEFKRDFIKFLKFYKSNILKGYEKPTFFDVVNECSSWLIEYKFYVQGIPCKMKISVGGVVSGDCERTNYKSVEEIRLDDYTKRPSIFYSFEINEAGEE